jgi:hypothetical protein
MHKHWASDSTLTLRYLPYCSLWNPFGSCLFPSDFLQRSQWVCRENFRWRLFLEDWFKALVDPFDDSLGGSWRLPVRGATTNPPSNGIVHRQLLRSPSSLQLSYCKLSMGNVVQFRCLFKLFCFNTRWSIFQGQLFQRINSYSEDLWDLPFPFPLFLRLLEFEVESTALSPLTARFSVQEQAAR